MVVLSCTRLLVFNYCLSVVTIFDVRSQTERIIEDVQALERYMNFPMTENEWHSWRKPTSTLAQAPAL